VAVRLVGKLSLRQNTSVQRFLAVEGRGIGLAVKSAPAQNKPSRPKQIDPRINPNGVSNYDPMLMLGSRNPNMASGRFNDPRSNS